MSIDDENVAAIIAGHWRQGSKLDRLPPECRPANLADGYRAQSVLAAAMEQRAIGWKIAATSVKGQAHIGVDGPIAGRLLQDRVVASGASVPMQGNRMRVAECEFVFRLSHDLPPREAAYSREEVAAAVAELRPGLELPDSRFMHFASAGAAQLAADNACAHWMVIGEATACDWRSLDLAAHATRMTVNGRTVTQGSGADVLGHPLDALAWLANAHALRGVGLHAGELVTTGVSGTPSPFQEGDAIVADLGSLGSVACVIGE